MSFKYGRLDTHFTARVDTEIGSVLDGGWR